MSIRIIEIGPDKYSLYNGIPSRFQVTSIFCVDEVDNGLGGFRMTEEKVPEPYIKNYGVEGDPISDWARQFDISKWGLFVACDGDRSVGGAAVAIETAVYPMDKFQREDLAVLWDLRVDPEDGRKGIGTALFLHAAEWARNKGYGQMGLETQNINVPACRFYAKMGCRLGAIHRYGYNGCPEVAHESMLLWYYEL
jgi:GNAT superfamily N-acetyltransferase